MRPRISFALLLAALVPAGAAPRPVDFDREIRPILSDNCFTCHGPDEKQRMVKLRLDTKEGAFADRGGYRVIVPGDAAGSRLYKRISAPDKAQRMPPPMANRFLTAAQVDLIRRWIAEGAKWEQHWAFLPPIRPALPELKKNKAWARNPIDAFILARLEREGLKPSPPADRATLLRRVTLDLTGLPPTPDELTAFLHDRSPNAYETVVDRLLASPRYGERMAMDWLDVARYADTHGYHIDSHRDMWPWRDWVIRAFNANMPFDRFATEQLAGDLLPDATVEQKIASGFNRNHMINFEGGAIPDEYLNEYVVDRVETTSVAFMGLTMGCARCHDHKYDPISQREFYRFYAFFNNIDEKGLDGRKGNAEPFLTLPSPAQKAELDRLNGTIQDRVWELHEAGIPALQKEWEKARLASLPPPPLAGLTAHYELDGSLSDISGHYRHGRTLAGTVGSQLGPVGRAADFDGETWAAFDAGDFDRGDAFTLAFWLRPTGYAESAVMQKIEDTAGRRGYELLLDGSEAVPVLKRGSRLSARLTSLWPADAIEIRTTARLLANTWTHVALAYDGSGKAAGMRLYLDGKPCEVEVLRDHLTGPIRNSRPLEIGNKALGGPYRGQIDDLRFYGSVLEATHIGQLFADEPLRASLRMPREKWSTEQKERVGEYFLTYDAPEPLRKMNRELEELRARCDRLELEIPTTMVMRELPKPRETFILARGDYRNHGERVGPGVPACLPPMPKDLPQNRLGLARWLLDPAHPLTSRVTVNRYWQMFFGNGIVKTSENFGSQGEPPVHAELLDWLATEFVRTGWDVKAMHRLIVTSAAYRQSSRATPRLVEKDPENRLLARGPRLRLPAETIRDSALAAAGLLRERLGGPSVFPSQPAGIWEDIAYGDVYSAQRYRQGHGADLYRRSMYSFWKRTMPPPDLITFDAPDREKCAARRTPTNTPLQALVLMNDPAYIEAARALAGRMMEAGPGASQRIARGFLLATARKPTTAETGILRDLARKQRLRFAEDRKAARELLSVGESPVDTKLDAAELAAWTTVASTILNLDETITKE